jgi:hypothetical protein
VSARPPRRRSFIIGGVAMLMFIIVGMAGGCSAHRRPPALTDEERELLDAPPLPYAVSIVPWDPATAPRKGANPEAYASNLAEIAIPSRAFRDVRREPTPGPQADLTAMSTGVYCNTAVIPLFTIISLGIIPTIWDETDCQGMTLHSARIRSGGSVQVAVRYKGRAVMGWGAIFLGVLPGWAYGDVRGDARYRERFRLEVIRHRQAIEQLTRSS